MADMRGYRKLFSLLIAMLLLQGASRGSVEAQADVEDPEVEAILEQMSPQDRVGQLFLVTFYGTDVGPESEIADLLMRYQVGGVVLLAENDNFTDEDDLPLQVRQLTADLQTLIAAQRPLSPGGFLDPLGGEGPYIPLFIGLEHEGSGGIHTHLRSGLTPLPSNMAIGATWDPAYAEAVGVVVGAELSALGINLLLGPPADVVEIPQPFTTGDLGTRVFGGESFWVSQMTAAYVQGVHVGSEGRLAVVPRHFPGHGGADRLAVVEVPTVRRSLDQLTQIDLQPFFAVTGDAVDPLSRADGVMTGHIRYQGFQGDNPRLATRPISLDSQNLPVLLKLEPIAGWHDAGGLVISEALGVRGVRRLYDPQETYFPNRRVAQDAFLAGNDMLYLGDFRSSPEADQAATVADTIDFFVQAYTEDPAFQTRVDKAVRRILRKKLDLYGAFELNMVLPASGDLGDLGQQSDVTLNVAQDALTLLSPDQADLLVSPQSGEHIVIISDTRVASQCQACEERSLIPVDALQTRILRLYGPQASGLISLGDVSSFSFERLVDYLEFGPQETTAENQTPEPDQLAIALDSADWIVFVMLDVDPNVPATNAVKQFLAEPPVSPDTRIVVMAMGAPYYLDSTEVSKLTAYYALYGYTNPFIDVAARALFQQAPLNGASPVSVNGINYDILEATSPDPNQVINLSYSIERAGGEEDTEGTVGEGGATPTPTPEPEPRVGMGDTLRLSTGVIFDQNGRPVPDGTPVEFLFNYVGEGLVTASVTTVAGVANTSLVIDRPGELEITVRSSPALNSLKLQVPIGGPVVVVPPDLPSATPTPTAVPTAVSPVEAVVATPIPTPQGPDVTDEVKSVDFSDLFLALIGLVVIGLVVFTLSFVQGRDFNVGLLFTLPTAVFGLLGYNYYALILPGSGNWRALFGEVWGAALATWIGALVGIVMMQLGRYLWQRRIIPSLRNRQRR